MSNKDLVNPVLEGIVSDATNTLRTTIEQRQIDRQTMINLYESR